MEDARILRLTSYLLSIAPEHFSAGIEPATEADIAALEATSGRPSLGYHRAFLLAMGNTPAGALDPFLNGRVFNIEALKVGYRDLAGSGLELPADLTLFSAPDSYSEFEFVRSRGAPDVEQEIGTLDFDSLEFTPERVGKLEDYVLKFAFTFRMGQFDHIRTFVPRSRWEPGPCQQVLAGKGMSPVFQFADGTTCYEGGPWAAVVYYDGSGDVASDDRAALFGLCGELEDLADCEIFPRPRLEAPKR